MNYLQPSPLRKLWSHRKSGTGNIEVIHVINDVNATGGAEKLVRDLVANAQNFSSSVVCIGGTTIRHQDFFFRQWRRAKVLAHILLAILIRFLRRSNQLPVLHIHLFPGLYLFSLVSGPRIYTEHATSNRRRKALFLRALERRILGSYDQVVAVSSDVRDSLVKWIPDATFEVCVIENGVDTRLFMPASEKLKTTELILGMAARFVAQKDQATLIRALARLPSTVHVKFAGDGPTLSSIKGLAQSLDVAERVQFLGKTEDMPDFYGGLDIYVQASHWEGQPLAVLEAMAMGCPVISADVGGVRSLLQDPDLLFPPADDQALAYRVARLMESDELREETASRLRRRAQGFDISRTQSEYLAIYDTVLTSRASD